MYNHMKKDSDTLKCKILDEAVLLFIEKGIQNVTTRELTECMGISRSHIYHYFDNWQTLCLEAVTVFVLNDLHQVRASLTPLMAKEKLDIVIHNYIPDSTDAVWQIYSDLWHQAAHSEAWAKLALTMLQRWENLLGEVITAGIAEGIFNTEAPGRVTRQLSALLNGYADKLIVSLSPRDRQIAFDDINHFIALALFN